MCVLPLYFMVVFTFLELILGGQGQYNPYMDGCRWVQMGADGCGWVHWCAITTTRGNMGMGGRRNTWFGGPGGREISHHIMLRRIMSKESANERQAHRTWTKGRNNHIHILTKTNENQQSPKTRENNENEPPADCLQTSHQWIIIRNYGGGN